MRANLWVVFLTAFLVGCGVTLPRPTEPAPTIPMPTEVPLLSPTPSPTNTPTVTPTATPPLTREELDIVFFEKGEAILGRTEEEMNQHYSQCVTFAGASGICDPMEVVFGDNLISEEPVTVGAVWLQRYEANVEGLPLRMSFAEAEEYCAELGGRLPTAIEWERAARGLEGRQWPWGSSEPTEELANLDLVWGNPDRQPVRVGSYPMGATPEGLLDMVGNVWEWTSDGNRRGGGAGTVPIFALPAHISPGELGGVRCAFDFPAP